MANYAILVTLTGKDNLSKPLRDVNRELDELPKKTKQAADESKALSDAWGNIKSALTVAAVAQAAVELYNLGTAANNAQNTFNQLSGGAGAAEQTLSKLRSATGGVVDDMTLMAGANKLLGMQLVQTGDEAARMIEMAVKLGGAMGNNAAESVDSFAAMLANRSIERLDSFGISSGKVREEVEKLKASGMGMDEAFAFAVFEEGAKSLDRLGAAATSSGAPVERMLTGINNLLQDIGQNVATAVNGLVGIAEIGLGMYPGQAEAEAAANEAAMQNAELYIGAFKTAIWDAARGTDTANAMEDFLTVDPQILNRMLQPAIDAMRENPDLNLGEWVSGWLSQNGMPVDWSSGISQTIAAALEQAVPAVESTSKFIKTMGDNVGITSKRVQEATQSFQAMTGPISAARDATTSFSKELKMLNGGIQEENKRLADMEAAATKYDLLMRDFAASEKDINLMAGGSIGQYVARDTANAIQAEFEAVQNQMQIMQSMFDEGLISEDQLNSAKNYADQIKGMADEAGRAADAFDRLKLSDLFGQQDGGVAGQVSDAILERMRSDGKTEEEIAAMQAELDKASGRETQASQFFVDTVVPAIADLPPAEAAKVQTAFSQMMEQAALQDLKPEVVALLQERFMQSIFQGGGATGSFTVTPYGTAPSVVPGSTEGASEAVSNVLAQKYGITLGSDLSGLDAMGGAGMIDPNQVRTEITNEMVKAVMDQNPLLNKEAILNNPIFKSAVEEAVAAAITPKAGTPGNVNTSTVSGIAAAYDLTYEDVMRAANISRPEDLKPGTYTFDQYRGFNADALSGFNPADFTSMYGVVSEGVDNKGTSAPDMMRETADAATDLSTSTYEISSNMETVNANTKEFVSSIQELAGKTTTVKINLDVDAGAFKAMLSQLGVNLDQVRSTRDNGGVVRGRDARVAE